MVSSVFQERKEWRSRWGEGTDGRWAGQTAVAEDGGSNVRLADRLFTTTIFSFPILSRGKRGETGDIVRRWGNTDFMALDALLVVTFLA